MQNVDSDGDARLLEAIPLHLRADGTVNLTSLGAEFGLHRSNMKPRVVALAVSGPRRPDIGRSSLSHAPLGFAPGGASFFAFQVSARGGCEAVGRVGHGRQPHDSANRRKVHLEGQSVRQLGGGVRRTDRHACPDHGRS